MASEAHSPRGIDAHREPGPASGPRLRAHGLAVWVTPGEGRDPDEAAMARAAQLLLARALKLAPGADVRLWPAPGAATTAGGRTRVPSSSAAQDSPQEDDGGAPHLPPSSGSGSLVSVDLAAGEVRLDGLRVPLSGVEFKLLRYLAENCSRTVSREELRLFLESFDSPAAASRSIHVYVGRVRRKLRGGRPAIATVRGGGYRFVPGPHIKVRGPAEYSI
ncbi:winged helix-turn-helix domain-containing protein [Arthrobacter sp. AL12]|uniref:winged helix-turn-helix domain-containing protein n=1 Tax=Arthrobacter sp. AL12 TaxID=3042241 RepID=UPI00249AA977|nr:winged helix-turn-helix domain-containing protein [Arthrobacter sp. AL12]MDI3212228.1 winged helix-turn-helix domain-containing protein [Arthrobacter sp. AL12]